MSESSFVILAVLLLGGLGTIIFLLMKKKAPLDDTQSLAMLERMAQQSEKLSQLAVQNTDLRKELDLKLSETHRASQGQFEQTTRIIQNITGQSAKLIADVTEKLAKLDETNKQVVNFSSQLQSLQDILKNPKQRGVLGEYYLEETLKNVLPPKSYALQYSLGKNEKTGKELIVDAVVFVKDKIIPIDAKFSLENYERLLNTTDPEARKKIEVLFKQDLKNRIDETSKYVMPEKGTLEFAFMFIPSEAIYYDLLVNSVGSVKVNTRDLIEYAFRDRKVIIVSPTSFLAYLQTVLQGLKAMQIEEKAVEIKANIEKLGKHMLSYDEFLRKLGTSLSTSVSHFNNAYHEFKKIDKDVIKITGGASQIEPMKIEAPK
ncbi:DNA recombination protein RmuC [Candidatus Falkowbacteria bacterium HGW-Falkowbacteria-2]|uniref:DNA recombination protein RmuC n=1 Tax=Candidatus Falkowbacteria bacterium HGW-Falkowbacteria-2 TaxID=2013769 RepID=A0A2N2DZ28_9BACT|nr:MAG: DNA recombination protein RmuC [Candidatus Falkowbacteria bacterium HGW-Falkowbacteria-2]